MKTSVVIATYNGSQFILEQLNSIINQSVLPSEIIISDDGSTDSTVELIEEFIDQNGKLPINFKLIHNISNNHGVVSNFQNAVLNASGDYIFFCDQDDLWFTNKIERIVNIMDSCDEEVVIHNAQVLLETGNGTFKPIEKHLMGSYPFDSNGLYKINGSSQVWPSFYYCLIQGMCICIRRNYLLTIFPFSKGSYHDFWILFCASADDTILAVSEDLAYYRIHKNNICGIPGYKKKRKFIERISNFDSQGKDSIIKQYTWYMDTSSYLGNRPILDSTVKSLFSFFTHGRIDAMSKRKIRATSALIHEYKKGVYAIDGKIVFFFA